PSMPNIMKAKKKTIDITSPEALGIDITPRTVTLKVEPPEPRKPGIKVESVQALVALLRDQEKII
ncbi:MAG TPA: electron transfer flavoprotein subunit beta/FixA family protein, partial [Gammaproteobacteria bacterium]|nr:electron transfer flavoprotein subunit beta/FixA family protein [Gammaproteobacteria bacterium]